MVLCKCSKGTKQKRKQGIRKEEFIMKVTVDRDGWRDYKENAWGEALNTLDDIEKRGREEEAMIILEDYFSEDVFGRIPSETEVNDFIRFNLSDIMHLYDADDDEDEEDDEEYEEDEE